jgi:hypothetical protein
MSTILPHGMGGLTEPSNFITLCHTCHCGLDPHFEVRLLWMVRGSTSAYGTDESLILGHEEGVRRYRRLSVPAHAGPQGSGNSGQDFISPLSLNFSSAEYSDGEAISLWLHAQDNMVRKYVKPHRCEA